MAVGGTHNFAVTSRGAQGSVLAHNCHRLSTDALDALLKPLEDNYPGTQDKLLICIFCTTEPERMRNTILSRCAPAFVIRPVTPVVVGDRLELVCKKEGIPYERSALDLIGEITECHVRDALKAVEGVSMLGTVDGPNVARYLHLDYASTVLSVLATLKTDLPASVMKAEGLLKTMSPITLYEKLSDLAMLAYRSSLGPVSVPSYLDRGEVETLGQTVGAELLDYVEKLSSRPGRLTAAMLLCDLSQLHRGIRLAFVETSKTSIIPPPASKVDGKVKLQVPDKPSTVDGVWINSRAVNSKGNERVEPQHTSEPVPSSLSSLEFFQLVKRRVLELDQQNVSDGQAGRTDMGDVGTHEGG